MVANTTASKKQKGRVLTQETAEAIRQTFGLPEMDVQSMPASVPGADILLSSNAREKFPYAVECKNQEKASPWQWIAQAETRRTEVMKPLVVFRRNRSDAYVIIKLSDFLEAVKR
jgi:hypothetical protein